MSEAKITKALKICRMETSEAYEKRYYTGYVYRDFMFSAYEIYQSSSEWAGLRKKVNEKYNHKCCECGKNGKGLTVHHTSYENWGKADIDEIEDCILLCRKCHNKIHKRNPYLAPFWARREVEETRNDIKHDIHMYCV